MKLDIKSLRIKQGYSQGVLAIKAGVGRGMVEKLENGNYVAVNMESIFRIARVLGVKTIDLLKDIDVPKTGATVLAFLTITIGG
jgi:transcriptional regulator with XRE-family HTH domain